MKKLLIACFFLSVSSLLFASDECQKKLTTFFEQMSAQLKELEETMNGMDKAAQTEYLLNFMRHNVPIELPTLSVSQETDI